MGKRHTVRDKKTGRFVKGEPAAPPGDKRIGQVKNGKKSAPKKKADRDPPPDSPPEEKNDLDMFNGALTIEF